MANSQLLSDLTADDVRKLLSYDPATGIFRWLVRTSQRTKVGSVTGKPARNAYSSIRIHGKSYQAHRLAWLLFFGKWPTHRIDHIDGDKSNNAIANLRECSHQQNLQNVERVGYSHNKSRPYAKKFQATITVDGKLKHLGFYMTAEEARAAYLAATKDHFGEFSVLNRHGASSRMLAHGRRDPKAQTDQLPNRYQFRPQLSGQTSRPVDGGKRT